MKDINCLYNISKRLLIFIFIFCIILNSTGFYAAIRFWEKPVNLLSFFNSIFEVFKDITYFPLVLDKYGIPIIILLIGLPLLLVLAIITWFYHQWLQIRQLQQSLGKSDAINNSGSTTEPGN